MRASFLPPKKPVEVIEKNAALTLPERRLDVMIPVNAIPKGYRWEDVGADLLSWLLQNHAALPPDGVVERTVLVGGRGRKTPLPLTVAFGTTSLPGIAGSSLISRRAMPSNLTAVVEKALATKLRKLVAACAQKRILLLESEHMSLGESQIYEEIVGLSSKFPALSMVDEIWFAEMFILTSQGFAYFILRDGRGLVEILTFENGVLKTRRDDRASLGPPWREF